MNELITENSIEVVKGKIVFNTYENVKQSAMKLAAQVNEVEVTEENIKTSKQLIASMNKELKRLNDYRINVKKEMLEPYNHFEQQVKEITQIIKESDETVRNQVKTLEEQEREEKRQQIATLFEKRMKQYNFQNLFTVNDFIQPKHLNKSISMNKVENEMVEWLETQDHVLQGLKSMEFASEILTEYQRTFDFAKSIDLVNSRKVQQQKVAEQLTKVESETVVFKATYTILDKKDAQLIELFMKQNNINYTKN